MATQQPEITKAIQEALTQVNDLAVRQEALAREMNPRPGSPAASVHEMPMHQFAWNQAILVSALCLDHLTAWSRLHGAGTQPTFAHYSLIRAALEGALLALWLCDPAIDRCERLARGTAVQRDSYRERKKWEQSTGGDWPARRGQARSGARRLLILDRAERRWRVHRIEVNLIDLATQFGTRGPMRGETTYRLLSAFAHAKEWAIFPASDVEEIAAPIGRSLGSSKVTASDSLTAYATRLAVDLASRAVDSLERYGGHR